MSAEEMSVKDLENLAAEGDADAQFELGMIYANGEGAEKNVAKAKKLLSDSANAGNVGAMEALADIFVDDKSEDRGLYVAHWYRQAISAGSETALKKLADYYYLGDGNSNKHAAVLYLENARRNEDDCEREVSIFTRMLESGWLVPEWKFYGDILQVLADNGNREAKHIIRREEVPEPEDDFDFDALLDEKFELPEITYEEKAKPVRRWGRTTVKRSLVSMLYDMGIEFTRTSNGIIKTKKGKEIESQIQTLIDRGYKFKYSYKTDKWTIMDKSGKE